MQGELVLVVHADSADIIASIIELKTELGANSKIHLVISGATEAHHLAAEL